MTLYKTYDVVTNPIDRECWAAKTPGPTCRLPQIHVLRLVAAMVGFRGAICIFRQAKEK